MLYEEIQCEAVSLFTSTGAYVRDLIRYQRAYSATDPYWEYAPSALEVDEARGQLVTLWHNPAGDRLIRIYSLADDSLLTQFPVVPMANYAAVNHAADRISINPVNGNLLVYGFDGDVGLVPKRLYIYSAAGALVGTVNPQVGINETLYPCRTLAGCYLPDGTIAAFGSRLRIMDEAGAVVSNTSFWILTQNGVALERVEDIAYSATANVLYITTNYNSTGDAIYPYSERTCGVTVYDISTDTHVGVWQSGGLKELAVSAMGANFYTAFGAATSLPNSDYNWWSGYTSYRTVSVGTYRPEVPGPYHILPFPEWDETPYALQAGYYRYTDIAARADGGFYYLGERKSTIAIPQPWARVDVDRSREFGTRIVLRTVNKGTTASVTRGSEAFFAGVSTALDVQDAAIAFRPDGTAEALLQRTDFTEYVRLSRDGGNTWEDG